MLIAAIAAAAFCATMAGGLFALRLRDRLHLVLGFSAGAVVGVAFFDLLPAALDIGTRHHSHATLLAWVALGFLAYLVLDRVLWLRGSVHHGVAASGVSERGILEAGSLSLHSFFDGLAIGLAFQASATLGTVVTIAVLTHDFSDGINTMSVVLKNGGTRRTALGWLAVDGIAPALGIGVASLVTLPDGVFGLVLAVFAGFFLYIGASDLIPESQHAHPKLLTTVMTLLGAAALYVVVALSGG